MGLSSFDELRKIRGAGAPVTVAVGAAADREVLAALLEVARGGLCDGLLYGPETETRSILNVLVPEGETEWGAYFRLFDTPDSGEAAAAAVRAVARGEAQVVMKGLVETSVILAAVLDKREGLRTDRLLSHLGLFEVPGFPRLLAVTDAAMNIAPDLEKKRQILLNGVDLLRGLGIEEPKVAVLCAKETVSDKMPCTVEAAELAKLQAAGEIEGCLVAGPYALDNAVSPEAAAHKGIAGPVAGAADLLLVPDIEAGNILYKALAFLAGARSAGVIVGAAAPIVLTSRADTAETKANSIALAVRFAAD